MTSESSTVVIPFPFDSKNTGEKSRREDSGDYSNRQQYFKWTKHPAIVKLSQVIDLESTCGYITMMNIRGSSTSSVARPSHSNTNIPGVIKLGNLAEVNTSDDEDQVIFSQSPNPHEPTNGFKDDKSAKLYKEELDSMVGEDFLEPDSGNGKPQVYDSRQQKIESLRLDLAATHHEAAFSSNSLLNKEASDSTVWYEDWVLLDCHFGLPLFDATVNEIISERIVSKKLLEETRY